MPRWPCAAASLMGLWLQPLRAAIPGPRLGLLPLCHPCSDALLIRRAKEMNADLAFIWGAEIWRLIGTKWEPIAGVGVRDNKGRKSPRVQRTKPSRGYWWGDLLTSLNHSQP
ncbi:unnamed protein product [Merluccius merluccius]